MVDDSRDYTERFLEMKASQDLLGLFLPVSTALSKAHNT